MVQLKNLEAVSDFCKNNSFSAHIINLKVALLFHPRTIGTIFGIFYYHLHKSYHIMAPRHINSITLSILLGMLLLLVIFSGSVDARGLKGAASTDIMEGEEMPMEDRELFEIPAEVQGIIDTVTTTVTALQNAYSVLQQLLSYFGVTI
jgi:hypothetical protein